MSLIQSRFVLFLFISIVSCVCESLKSIAPTEVTTGREAVKINTVNDVLMSATRRGRRFDKGILGGIQENTREKNAAGKEQMAEAAELPPLKIVTLSALLFRNMLSKGLVGKDPPLRPEYAVKPFVKMIQSGIAVMKDSIG